MSAPTDWRALATETGRGTAPGLVVLKERGSDVRVARVTHPAGNGTVVVKLWNRRGGRGRIRRLTRTNIGWREYTALRVLETRRIGAPQPLAYLTLRDPRSAYTEALISSDLGECRRAMAVFKELLTEGNEDRVRSFETALINATAGMLAAGLIDTDHRIPNFAVPAGSDMPVRLDFELCRRVRRVAWHPRLLGRMLGTLLGTYVFAVQPDMDRVPDFGARLRAAVCPSARARRHALARVSEMLNRQSANRGVITDKPRIWDAEEQQGG